MFSVRHLVKSKKALKPIKLSLNVVQTASITGRATRGGPLELQKPFPYEKKQFRGWHKIFDNTMLRVSEENAKLIVIEGPIAAGKSAFGKALAEEFDMIFVPEPTMDDLLILPSGYDLRLHDHELSPMAQSYDHKNFCLNPTDVRNILFRYYMICLKVFQMTDVLAHILNTGQGVVMERSYFSDYVFANAQVEQKFLSKEAAKWLNFVRRNTSTFFLTPHLVIYLDMPVPVVQERIRTRNYSYEQNSPALTKEYLESLERNWKQDYLPIASLNSEVLVYDWSDGGDVEAVVDDIETFDFSTLRPDLKLEPWRMRKSILTKYREFYTNRKDTMNKYLYFPYYKIPELSHMSVAMFKEMDKVLSKIPECQFDKGYNYLMGDSKLKILFKTNIEDHRALKSHMRWYVHVFYNFSPTREFFYFKDHFDVHSVTVCILQKLSGESFPESEYDGMLHTFRPHKSPNRFRRNDSLAKNSDQNMILPTGVATK